MQRGWIVGIVATISACGLELAGLGGAPTTNSADGATNDADPGTDGDPSNDGSSGDGADISIPPFDAGGNCDPTKPFDSPTNVSALNSNRDEANVWFTADELFAYLIIGDGSSSSRDIYLAGRPDKQTAWSAPILLSNVNTSVQEDNATVTADGKTLYWATERTGVGGFDVWYATRPQNSGPFTTPGIVSGFNTPSNDGNPFIMPDGNTIYFDSFGLGGAGGSDIFTATRLSDGGFSATQNVGGVNSNVNDFQPILTPDALFMVFGSERDGGLGGFDLYSAERGTPSGSFTNVKHLTSASSANVDLPTWISPDRCVLYFSSDRPNGLGGRDIYRAARPK